MDISIVVATDLNGGIGKDNKLLWHLPADLKFFKETTTGHPVIMGRKTFESVGRPLPNRINIIITRNLNWKSDGVLNANSLDEALALCPPDSSPKIIGGGEIYKQALPLANRVYLTVVHTQVEADTFFSVLDPKIWKESSSQFRPNDEKNPLDMEFKVFERKN
jgi:dihydrofolate reductase